MNRLPRAKREKILTLLVEGCSMKSIMRAEKVHLDTITRLLIDAGKACMDFHDAAVRNLRLTKRVQVDEMWSFVYCKQKTVPYARKAPPDAGDVWTWTGLDADSKMLISWVFGPRDSGSAYRLMHDLAFRVPGRVQLSTDGFLAYLDAVESAFGGDVDFAQVIKAYGPAEGEPERERRYSPGVCTSVRKVPIMGDPIDGYISTSYVERSNLNFRMGNRRFTRLTNGFSKKVANHAYQVALYVVYHNWCRQHTTTRLAPAQAAGLTDELRDMDWLTGLVEARDKPPGPRGPYRRERKKRKDAGIKRA
ncbi:MAG: IS1 family transposase [Acidobacteria bacterium]|nr:IS1 family transposase [Acidobacteriota bacterium]